MSDRHRWIELARRLTMVAADTYADVALEACALCGRTRSLINGREPVEGWNPCDLAGNAPQFPGEVKP